LSNALSVYLDALRFGAAFMVFLSHYSAGRYSGGLFWQFMGYGRTSVLVFFVLSGFVIAWVSEIHESNLHQYAVSRIARLYSVMIPAFVLTAVLDHIGFTVDPSLYPSITGSTHPLLGYVLSMVFLGESWTLTMLPGSNIPFWSLNYEAWYYVLFAGAVFLRGRARLVVLVVAALLAGPKVLLLFPIWLMGVAAWRWRNLLPARLGAPLIFGAIIAFAALEALGGQRLFWRAETTVWLTYQYSAYDYLASVIVALLIVGLANACLPMPSPRLVRLIRWLAGTTFGLYLLHYPLLNFFAAVIPGPAGGPIHQALMFGLTLGVALALARLTEQRKGMLKGLLYSGMDRLRVWAPSLNQSTMK
jgi:peptidoglycan/LPS O-acetylase OafA/YrhL